MIRNGHKLVILDDLILDVSKFILLHPGGQFSLRQNIGRDVSKFFHGGYSLENINDPVKNHKHSRDARTIVNSLIIGKFVDEAPVKVMALALAERNANKSGTCKTFKFREVAHYVKQNGVEDDNGQQQLLQNSMKNPALCPLLDVAQIGRHYLLKYTGFGHFEPLKPGIKRHYTECFCMRPEVYENLLKIGQNLSNSQAEAAIVREFIQKSNANDLSLSIKEYANLGLSNAIHNHKTTGLKDIEVKGPMGSGIKTQSRGRHIAYTAGTGVLVFMDLVAHLLIKVIELNGGPQIIGSS